MAEIYVVSVADYNAGVDHGVWINLDRKDKDGVLEEIAALLAESKQDVAEDWAIHDSDGFGPVDIPGNAALESLCALNDALGTYSDDALLDLVDYNGGLSGVEESIGAVRDDYRGTFDSLADFAEQEVIDVFGREVPSFLEGYIDWERMGEDLTRSDCYEVPASNGKIHIFSNY